MNFWSDYIFYKIISSQTKYSDLKRKNTKIYSSGLINKTYSNLNHSSTAENKKEYFIKENQGDSINEKKSFARIPGPGKPIIDSGSAIEK